MFAVPSLRSPLVVPVALSLSVHVLAHPLYCAYVPVVVTHLPSHRRSKRDGRRVFDFQNASSGLIQTWPCRSRNSKLPLPGCENVPSQPAFSSTTRLMVTVVPEPEMVPVNRIAGLARMSACAFAATFFAVRPASGSAASEAGGLPPHAVTPASNAAPMTTTPIRMVNQGMASDRAMRG